MYCPHCGKRLSNAAVFCPGCGCSTRGGAPTAFASANFTPSKKPKHYVKSLARKLRVYGTFWILIGCLQAQIGIPIGINIGEEMGIAVIFIAAIVALANIIAGAKYCRYANKIETKPKNIIEQFDSTGDAVAWLIFNILFGNLIGIVLQIYYFAGIRGYVLRNEHIFCLFDQYDF